MTNLINLRLRMLHFSVETHQVIVCDRRLTPGFIYHVGLHPAA